MGEEGAPYERLLAELRGMLDRSERDYSMGHKLGASLHLSKVAYLADIVGRSLIVGDDDRLAYLAQQVGR